MLVGSKINIDKDNNTTHIRGNYCYNAYLIGYYKTSVHTYFTFSSLTGVQFSHIQLLLYISAKFTQ